MRSVVHAKTEELAKNLERFDETLTLFEVVIIIMEVSANILHVGTRAFKSFQQLAHPKLASVTGVHVHLWLVVYNLSSTTMPMNGGAGGGGDDGDGGLLLLGVRGACIRVRARSTRNNSTRVLLVALALMARHGVCVLLRKATGSATVSKYGIYTVWICFLFKSTGYPHQFCFLNYTQVMTKNLVVLALLARPFGISDSATAALLTRAFKVRRTRG